MLNVSFDSHSVKVAGNLDVSDHLSAARNTEGEIPL
jgi:hypothetical protein